MIHDATLDRTTNGRGAVRRLTLAEIRRFSAGYPTRFGSAYAGERVPTLAEALGLLRDRARAMIEIKPEAVTDDAEGGIEAHVVEEVRKARMEKEIALISFERRALVRCRTLAPEILRGHLFERGKAGDMLAGGARGRLGADHAREAAALGRPARPRPRSGREGRDLGGGRRRRSCGGSCASSSTASAPTGRARCWRRCSPA